MQRSDSCRERPRLLAVAALGVCSLSAAAAAQPGPPPNDRCEAAIQIGLGSTQFSTVGASASEPGVPCATIGADIWYRLTIPANGVLTAQVCNSSFDTVLAAHAGPQCVGPVIACNDDSCGLQSQISFDVQARSTIFLRVGGFFGDTGGGVLTVTFAPSGVPNDSCSTCEQITGTGEFPFDNSDATTGNEGQDVPACDFEGTTRITRDVWFCWRAPCTGPVTIQTCGLTDVDTKLAVYTEACAAQVVACNDDACGLQSSVTFNAVAERQYFIQLGTYEDARGGRGAFRITCDPPAPVACCLPDGSCVNLAPADCRERRGVPGRPGTQCADPLGGRLGFAAVNENIVPRAWQPKVVNWTRDRNGNSVEDAIDQMDPGALVDVILCLNEAPRKGDLTRFASKGSLGYVSKFLPVVVMRGIPVAEAQAFAMDERVALVQLDHVGVYTTDTSVQAMRVRASGTYSPNTVEDVYPAIDGSGITIAVIDSGVDNPGGPGTTHTALPMIVGGFDATTLAEGDPDDTNGVGHGTHVAGIALGRALSGRRGVAPGANLVDMLVGSAAPTEAAVIAALDKCIERRVDWNIRVATLSLSLGGSDNGLSASAMAVNRAVQAGIVVTCAIGNSGPANIVPPPASADYAITVAGAFDQGTIDRTDDTLYAGSNRGPRLDDGDLDTLEEMKPDVTAYGESIDSCRNNTTNQYRILTGTSMASPHVAGLAALVLQSRPGILPLSVKEHIIATSEDRGSAGWDTSWGNGLVNGFAAVDSLFTGTTTDLRFDCWMGAPAASCGGNGWWFSPDVRPVNPMIEEGVANSIKARVHNAGPNPAVNFKVKIGVYNFSNSMADYHVATVLVPGPLAPGATTSVTVPWTPVISGGAIGTVHACIKGEIIYASDSDYSNNGAQHNIDIVNTFSPARFQMQVVNPTDVPLTIGFSHDLNECQGNADWSVLVPDSFVMLPGEPPRTVEILVDPVETQRGSRVVSIEVVGTREDGRTVSLGGVGLVAQTRDIPDCNRNGVDDNIEIRLQLTDDINNNGIPDDCEKLDCPCDFNLSGILNSQDFFDYLTCFFGEGCPAGRTADFNGNGTVDSQDFFDFLGCFFQPPAECR